MKIIRLTCFIGISIIFSYVIVNSIQHIRAEVLYRNGYIKSQRGFPKLAIKDFSTTVKLMPWENHYRLQLAQNYEATAGKFQNEFKYYINLAIKEYEKLIKADPLNPWFRARLGLIYHDLAKRFPNEASFKTIAQELAKSATNADPKNPLFTLHYAHFLFTYGLTDEAKQYYQKSINYDFDLTEAHFKIGGIYIIEKNIDKALSHYETVI